MQASTHADGTSTMGMFFRVNGAAIFSRGANMIPMEELEGRMNSDAHRCTCVCVRVCVCVLLDLVISLYGRIRVPRGAPDELRHA